MHDLKEKNKKIRSIFFALLFGVSLLFQPLFSAFADDAAMVGSVPAVTVETQSPAGMSEAAQEALEVPAAGSKNTQIPENNEDKPTPADSGAPTSTPESAADDPCALLAADNAGPDLNLQPVTTGTSSLAALPLDSACVQQASSSTLEIINQNDADIANTVVATSTTGLNGVDSPGGRDVSVRTGNVHVFANVINVVNTNSVNSSINQIAQNFNSLSANIALDHMEYGPEVAAEGFLQGLCGAVECQGMSSFVLANQNSADIANNVVLQGNSGGNAISGVQNGPGIYTGDVYAVVNILNIVNTNAVNSRLTLASINIFGDWAGDLVLPSGLYFQKYFSIGSTTASLLDAGSISLDITNSNEANIENNVSVIASTGNNSVTASSTETGGGMASTTLATGSSQSVANVQNVANTTVVNGMWFLGMVNVLGGWNGGVYSLPSQVTMSNGPTGLTFFSSAGIPSVASGGGLGEVQVDIRNNNTATISNNVSVHANSGGNEISASSLSDTEIITGNSAALANILNFANTNLVNSNVQIGMVNIFGNWQGNVVFGYPDIGVEQYLKSDRFPMEAGKPVRYGVRYFNDSKSFVENAELEWRFNEAYLKNVKIISPVPYEFLSPSVVRFSVGRIEAQTGSEIVIEAEAGQDFQESSTVTTRAHIMANAPELNLQNNFSIFNAQAARPESIGIITASDPGEPAGLLRVSKKMFGSPTSTGESEFAITVHNDGSGALYNVEVIDELLDSSGTVVLTKTFSVGNMAPHEEVIINYTLDAEHADGLYTNSAYALAKNGDGSAVSSGNPSLVSFSVAAPLPNVLPDLLRYSAPHIATSSTGTVVSLIKPSIKRLQNNVPANMELAPQVAGAGISNEAGLPADFGFIDTPNSPYKQWLLIILGCLLIGLVYAILKRLERRD